MGAIEILEYLERELIVCPDELKEALEEFCSPQSTTFALGRLVKHHEVIRFNIGLRRYYVVPEIQHILIEC